MLCKVANSHTIIYQIDGIPYFFDVDGRGNYYPSVYCLWKFPKLMETRIVQPNAFQFLLRGADLFLPGVLVPENGYEWRKGKKLSVTLLLYGLPIAVGHSLIDDKDVATMGMKGKGVKIIHYYRDHLWELGDKSHPQDQEGWKMDKQWPGFEKYYSEFQSKDFDLNEDGEGKEGEKKETAEGEEGEKGKEAEEGAEETQVTVEEMDERIRRAFLNALKAKLKKGDLPILINVFWGDFVIPCAAEGAPVDLRHSSYKKLTKFLEVMAEKGIVKIEEPSPGVHQITSFDKSIPEVSKFKVDEALLTESGPSTNAKANTNTAAPPLSTSSYTTSASPDEKKALVVELFGAPQSLQPLFLGLGQEKRHLYTKKEVVDFLWTYAHKENLGDKGACKLDELLQKALYKKGQEPPASLPKKELAELFLSKMTNFHEVNRGGYSEIKKGPVKPVVITLEQRQGGRKHITRVSGLESFAIPPKDLAEELRQQCAASTSVKNVEGKVGGVEVMVQGLAVRQAADHLVKKYEVPRKYIQNVDRTKAKKKK